MILHEADVADLERRVCLELKSRVYSTIDNPETCDGRRVRAWLRALDLAFLADIGYEAPPVWIAHRFRWGPHCWPISWSDVPHMPVVDCGAIAALSTEVLSWRGTLALPIQLLLNFTPESIRGWQALWSEARVSCTWSHDTIAYHEATLVVLPDGQGRIWDALGRFWLPIVPRPGYEGIVALRFHGPNNVDTIVTLAGQRVRSGRWYSVSGSLASPTRKTVGRSRPTVRQIGAR